MWDSNEFIVYPTLITRMLWVYVLSVSMLLRVSNLLDVYYLHLIIKL